MVRQSDMFLAKKLSFGYFINPSTSIKKETNNDFKVPEYEIYDVINPNESYYSTRGNFNVN